MSPVSPHNTLSSKHTLTKTQICGLHPASILTWWPRQHPMIEARSDSLVMLHQVEVHQPRDSKVPSRGVVLATTLILKRQKLFAQSFSAKFKLIGVWDPRSQLRRLSSILLLCFGHHLLTTESILGVVVSHSCLYAHSFYII